MTIFPTIIYSHPDCKKKEIELLKSGAAKTKIDPKMLSDITTNT
jgi:hypothetical protein